MTLRNMILGALIVALCFVWFPRGSADARPEDGILPGSGLMVAMPKTGTNWYGAYQVGTATGYCIDLQSAPPKRASAWRTSQPQIITKQYEKAPSGYTPHGKGPHTVSQTDRAQITWVLHTTGRAPSAVVGAAVEHFVRVRTLDGAGQKAREAVRWQAVTKASPEAARRYEQLEADARRFAGPYRAELTWVSAPTADEPTGQIRARVLSSANVPLPDQQFRITAEGAVTVHNVPDTTSAKGEALIDVSMESPRDQPISGAIDLVFSDLAGTTPVLYTPVETTVQRIVSAPPPISVSADLSVSLKPKATPPPPTTPPVSTPPPSTPPATTPPPTTPPVTTPPVTTPPSTPPATTPPPSTPPPTTPPVTTPPPSTPSVTVPPSVPEETPPAPSTPAVPPPPPVAPPGLPHTGAAGSTDGI